jgi:hypothetical protein
MMISYHSELQPFFPCILDQTWMQEYCVEYITTHIATSLSIEYLLLWINILKNISTNWANINIYYIHHRN